MMRKLFSLNLFFLVFISFSTSGWASPGLMTYQGQLTDAAGVPVTDTLSMTFSIYDADAGGTLLWQEAHPDVAVVNGLYSIMLGSYQALDVQLFSGGNAWLEVNCGGELLTPRQRIASTVFALQANAAFSADDAAHLEGHSAADLDQSGHVQDTGNPHAVTAAQTGSMTMAQHTWSNLVGIPTDIADGDDTGVATEGDPTVPDSVKDGVSWGELSGIPADIADGDQTGLDPAQDYGRFGVTNYLFEGTTSLTNKYVKQSGDSMSASLSGTILHVTNSGTGNALVSEAAGADARAVYGLAIGATAKGIYGFANNTGNVVNYGGYFEAAGLLGRGVYAEATNTGSGRNYGGYFLAGGSDGRGVLGSAYGANGRGVYGSASSTASGINYGGYFESGGPNGRGVYGLASNTGNVVNYGGYFEAMGTAGYGVYAVSAGEAVHAVSASSNAVSALTQSTSQNQWAPAIYGRNEGAGGGVYGWSQNWHGTTGVSLSNSYAGIWAVNNAGGPAIKADGNVLVTTGRTITPVLEITGGADLSERFDISAEDGLLPEPGMLVSIDAQKPGELTISKEAYDRKIAGIISGAGGINPGMLMGQVGSRADGVSPVALSGRVYCWADASINPIEPGDLLTSSDTPGYAMRVNDYEMAQGAILGKAMSPLKASKGLVLVLVTLQ